jgi:hypothetical protein
MEPYKTLRQFKYVHISSRLEYESLSPDISAQNIKLPLSPCLLTPSRLKERGWGRGEKG